MAADKASLQAAIKAAFIAAPGTDDDFETISSDLANAIDTYAKTLKATGSDAPSGDTHNLDIG